MQGKSLTLRGLNSFYGKAHVLFDIDLEVPAGARLALLGRNGAGKSSLLKSVVGAGIRAEGEVRFGDRVISRLQTDEIARLGVQLVPEDRRVYKRLSVRENLQLGLISAGPGRDRIELGQLLIAFPTLHGLLTRHGGQLSGGEQQLVAIARAMMGSPELLLLDEPSAGLSPTVWQLVGEAIKHLQQEYSITTVIAEQNAGLALALCTSVLLVDDGRIMFHGSVEEFRANRDFTKRYLQI